MPENEVWGITRSIRGVVASEVKLMEVEEAIRTRRSTRHYDKTLPVERRQIEELIELANLAPSSFNLQHWKFIVVDDPERKKTEAGTI